MNIAVSACVGPQFRISPHEGDDFLNEALEQIQLRRRRVAVDKSARLDKGHRWQRSVLNVVVEVDGVLEVVRTCALVMMEVEYCAQLQMNTVLLALAAAGPEYALLPARRADHDRSHDGNGHSAHGRRRHRSVSNSPSSH